MAEHIPRDDHGVSVVFNSPTVSPSVMTMQHVFALRFCMFNSMHRLNYAPNGASLNPVVRTTLQRTSCSKRNAGG